MIFSLTAVLIVWLFQLRDATAATATAAPAAANPPPSVAVLMLMLLILMLMLALQALASRIVNTGVVAASSQSWLASCCPAACVTRCGLLGIISCCACPRRGAASVRGAVLVFCGRTLRVYDSSVYATVCSVRHHAVAVSSGGSRRSSSAGVVGSPRRNHTCSRRGAPTSAQRRPQARAHGRSAPAAQP